MAKKLTKNYPLGGKKFGTKISYQRTVQVGRQRRYFNVRSRNVQRPANRPNQMYSGNVYV